MEKTINVVGNVGRIISFVDSVSADTIELSNGVIRMQNYLWRKKMLIYSVLKIKSRKTQWSNGSSNTPDQFSIRLSSSGLFCPARCWGIYLSGNRDVRKGQKKKSKILHIFSKFYDFLVVVYLQSFFTNY